MAVIFPRWTNLLPFAGAVGGLLGLPGALVGLYFFVYSPEWTDVGHMPRQPIPFSHQLHAGELDMDCRYCHFTVERAPLAAVPPNEVCMNCHATVATDKASLYKVRETARSGEAIEWKRVHMLPDYVYFNHSVHVAGGVGCSTCHGRVDQMPEVAQHEPLSMLWCLDCHRDPEPNLRPLDKVTDMAWDTATANYDMKADPARKRKTVDPPVHCSGCHR